MRKCVGNDSLHSCGAASSPPYNVCSRRGCVSVIVCSVVFSVFSVFVLLSLLSLVSTRDKPTAERYNIFTKSAE